MNAVHDPVIYHILPSENWERAREQGDYRPASLTNEGFIHLSTRDQVAGTLSRFFADHSGLILLCIDVARLHSELRYDAADGQFFPHLYGPLNLDAVVDVLKIAPGTNDPFSDSAE
jgi:uncharacterized protein (DUF952 family)